MKLASRACASRVPRLDGGMKNSHGRISRKPSDYSQGVDRGSPRVRSEESQVDRRNINRLLARWSDGAYVLVVALIVRVHRHLLEVRHGGRVIVSALLRHVILRVIDGRRRQAVRQQRVRRQVQDDRPLLRRGVLVAGALLLSPLRRRLVHRGVR